MAKEYEMERLAVVVGFDEYSLYTETYGFAGTGGTIFLEGQRLIPKDHPSDTVILFMHPSSVLQLMPLPTGLAKAGVHVLCCGSRYAKNDTPLIMEKVLIDYGAYVRYAKEELGYMSCSEDGAAVVLLLCSINRKLRTRALRQHLRAIRSTSPRRT